MSDPQPTADGDHRILVHAPRGRDADVVRQVLKGLSGATRICASLAELAGAASDADIAFITEESLAAPDAPLLAHWVSEQPPWSDFPFIVLASRRVGRRPIEASGALSNLGNVVLLERPLNADTLTSAARSALRGRARQYQARRHLAARSELELEREALLVAEREARLEAERAGRMKDDFLATLSHELRTPLSAILGWTHLLARPNAGAVDVAKAASTIERNARAQARLIEELLDVSRIASGQFQLDIQSVSVSSVFDAVIQSLKPAADAKGIVVRRAEGSASFELDADPGRLQQVIRNLVANAIKFTPLGGQVVLDAALDPGQAKLTVSDSGAGIAAEFLPHVFERFRQADPSEARSFGGLGLGLAIVRQLVEMHGGSVAAESAGLGRGSTFTVRLPLVQADRIDLHAGPESTAVASVPALDLRGLRVLVVDDEADGREALARILTGHGAEVTSAGSADEALQALERCEPELLVSDVGMPRVDGYELIRRVRRLDHPTRCAIPAIALTAFARPGDAAKARDAGFGVHLAKPVEPSLLLATIGAVFKERVAAQASDEKR